MRYQKIVVRKMPDNYGTGCHDSVRFFEEGRRLHMIERSTEVITIDVLDENEMPVDLSGAIAKFHIMDFATRTHVLSKNCEIITMPNPRYDRAIYSYPYTVRVLLHSNDTNGMAGHYIGQLELIDFQGESNFCFQVEIIISKNAYDLV